MQIDGRPAWEVLREFYPRLTDEDVAGMVEAVDECLDNYREGIPPDPWVTDGNDPGWARVRTDRRPGGNTCGRPGPGTV